MCLLLMDEPICSTLRAGDPLLRPCSGDGEHHRVTDRVRCSFCTAVSGLLISHLNLRLVVPGIPSTSSTGRSYPCARSRCVPVTTTAVSALVEVALLLLVEDCGSPPA